MRRAESQVSFGWRKKESHNAKLTMEVEELQSAVDASLSSVYASLAVTREEVKVARSQAQLAEAATAQATRQQVAAWEALSTLQLPANEVKIYGKAKKYCLNSFFQYINLSTRGRDKLFQHANNLCNIIPLR
jgi:hypothetical protein